MKHWVTKRQIFCSYSDRLLDSWIPGATFSPGFMGALISVGGFHRNQCPANWFIFSFLAGQLLAAHSPLTELIAQSLHKQKCVDRSIFRFFKSLHMFLLQAYRWLLLLFFLNLSQNVCFIFPQFLYQFFCGFSQQVSSWYWRGVKVSKHPMYVCTVFTYPQCFSLYHCMLLLILVYIYRPCPCV